MNASSPSPSSSPSSSAAPAPVTDAAILLADIGGTNARFALLEGGRVGKRRTLAEYTANSVAELVEMYLDGLKDGRPKVAAAHLATAGAHTPAGVFMAARNWKFSAADVGQALGVPVHLYNDLYAVARALPLLTKRDVAPVLAAETGNGAGPKLAIGIGTGLGLAVIKPVTTDGKELWAVTATEGGQVDLPLYRTDFKIHTVLQRILHQEEAIYRPLLQDQIPIIAELVLSGRGLTHLYNAACQLEHKPRNAYEPAQIIEKAGSCPMCLKAVEYFINFLGRFVRSAMLMHGATGGIYLTGGVISALHDADLFDARQFREACFGVGRGGIDAYLKTMPVYLVPQDGIAFRGLKALAEG